MLVVYIEYSIWQRMVIIRNIGSQVVNMPLDFTD